MSWYNEVRNQLKVGIGEKGGMVKTVLEQERIKIGMSREQLAQKIGITSEAVRLLENGKRKPSYDVLVKLLDLFGYSDPRELFAEAPENQPISNKE